jgi:hypothetical protein
MGSSDDIQSKTILNMINDGIKSFLLILLEFFQKFYFIRKEIKNKFCLLYSYEMNKISITIYQYE